MKSGDLTMPGVRETINSSFTACRVGLRKCWQWIQCHKPIVFILQDQYNVLCLGLSGAGKTTLLSHLVQEPLSNCEPTRGFNIKTLPIKNTVISIKELGGSFQVQPFWDHYFGNKNGILFVVDSTDSEEELNTAQEALRVVLADHRLTGKPCLILGTHSDLEGARNSEEIERYFKPLMNGRKWCVSCCSAYDRTQIIAALETLIDLMVMNV
ncbi:ADP-ribosylation factor-like protein 15 isoform X1 [Panonychus citri]|uniref:ADP-ribosylation factor-like protein 15 isoform X1 n=2 Tax=Panonychus citri TaxID=50023 RepID=UPI00230802CD|nr:ADP-ribosylation factor-like protein 15 isoform X1 [Panonychus citri]